MVAAILIVLAGLGLAQYRNSVTRASEAVLKEDLFRMRDAIDQYYADKMTVARLARRARERRLHAEAARRSVHDELEQLADVRASPTPTTHGLPGVYDVKSGSEATRSTTPNTRTGGDRPRLDMVIG